jgi:hypothetical protein
MQSVRIAAGMEAIIATAAMRPRFTLRLRVTPCPRFPHDREAAEREFFFSTRTNNLIFGGIAHEQ